MGALAIVERGRSSVVTTTGYFCDVPRVRSDFRAGDCAVAGAELRNRRPNVCAAVERFRHDRRRHRRVFLLGFSALCVGGCPRHRSSRGTTSWCRRRDCRAETLRVAYHRRRSELFGGIKFGLRGSRFGLFGKVRPGFTRLTHRGFDCAGSMCALAVFMLPEYTTEFALDLGGIVEFYPTRRLVARFDLGCDSRQLDVFATACQAFCRILKQPMTEIDRLTRTRLVVLMWGLASAPVAWLLLFGLFILRARVTLGRWPAPYQPDPKDLGFDLHHAAIVAGIPLMFAAVLCATALTFLMHDRPTRLWLLRVAAVAGLVAVIALARADPGYVFTWLGD